MSSTPRRGSQAIGGNTAFLSQLAQHASGNAAGGDSPQPGSTTPKSARRHIHTRERSFTASDIDISAAGAKD